MLAGLFFIWYFSLVFRVFLFYSFHFFFSLTLCVFSFRFSVTCCVSCVYMCVSRVHCTNFIYSDLFYFVFYFHVSLSFGCRAVPCCCATKNGRTHISTHSSTEIPSERKRYIESCLNFGLRYAVCNYKWNKQNKWHKEQ